MPPKFSARPPKTLPKSQDAPKTSQVQLKTPILTPLWSIWDPTWCHLGPNFAHLEPNFVENSDRIVPNMPGRTRRPLQITIFLDFGPSRPRFSMILGTFCKYFKRCFAHCVRPPTCSFDASGQRFSFILVPFPAYFLYVLHLFRKVFCMPCAISFDLFQNRLDLDLVLRRSIGEACSIRRSTYWML